MRRWEELRPELDARGIVIVAVSSDTVEKTASGMPKHGLKGVMLSDPDLVVTDRYNLRNPRNFALKTGIIVPLAIPTTFLVDRSGTVRWIDQTDDYRKRSDPDRVLGAIRAALDRVRVGEESREPAPAEDGQAELESGAHDDERHSDGRHHHR